MSVKIQDCLRNLGLCRPGEHPLFRGYGLNDVDSPYGLSYGEVKNQVAEYYPDVDSVFIERRSTAGDLALGQYRYTITFRGVEGR
jgi:hypothetical protein